MTDQPPSASSPWTAYGLALALAAAATLLAVIAGQWAPAATLALIFVLPVVIAAASYGWGPALTAAVAGALAFNFFLIEPRYTLRVADPAHVWAIGLLLVVAAIVSAVAAESRRRALDAERHADQALALQGLAQALAAAPDRAAVTMAAADALTRLFRAPAAILAMDGDDLEVAATAGGAVLSDQDMDAARWCLASRLATRSQAYPAEQSRFDFWPVVTPSRIQAAVGLGLAGREDRPEAVDRLVGMVGGHLSVALERERFARQSLDAAVSLESERLKADLLAAVSHDLRTPLSTILLTLQSLQTFADAHDAEARGQLLAVAEAEAARLAGLVDNLLDMNRLDAEVVAARPSPVAVGDLVGAALRRAHGALEGHPVRTHLAPDLPEVMIDFGLAETALANILQNAGRYGAPATPVTVRVRRAGGAVVVEVTDEGPGFPEPVEPLFAKFARGVEGDGRPPGVGLGLAIARGFLSIQGGAVTAANRQDGRGAVVTISLPLAQETAAP